MRDKVANLVYPTILHALSLKEDLSKSDPDRLKLDVEQGIFKQYLNPSVTHGAEVFVGDPAPHGDPYNYNRFLGIRYILACWLDEIFIEDSPWSEKWNEKKLEPDLFPPTSERATRFWEQARRAENLPDGDDALEVCFLCVMLGFQGEARDKPDDLRAWITRTQKRLATRLNSQPDLPADIEPTADVPPRTGRYRFARMLVVGGLCLVVAIILAVILSKVR